VVDNTLQQSLLFLVGALALSVGTSRPSDAADRGRGAGVLVARIVFWIGYRIDPLYRAFGMAATSYLNVFILGYALWKTLA
jgi:hypothetical protein